MGIRTLKVDRNGSHPMVSYTPIHVHVHVHTDIHVHVVEYTVYIVICVGRC